MKQIKINRMYRGFQFEVCFCCKTKKDAAKILDCSMYEVNTWGNFDGNSLDKCHKNPYLKFVYFGIMSGEMRLIKPEWNGKVIKYKDVIDFIDEHRNRFKTYSETEKAYNNQ